MIKITVVEQLEDTLNKEFSDLLYVLNKYFKMEVLLNAQVLVQVSYRMPERKLYIVLMINFQKLVKYDYGLCLC